MRSRHRSSEIFDQTTNLVAVKSQVGCESETPQWDSRQKGKRKSTVSGDHEGTATVHTPKKEVPTNVGDTMKVAGVPKIDAGAIHPMMGANRAQGSRIAAVICKILKGPARGGLTQGEPQTFRVPAQMRMTMLVSVAGTVGASAMTAVGRRTSATSSLLLTKPKWYRFGP